MPNLPCPTREAIDAWKHTLVALSHAFDTETNRSLLLLFKHKDLLVSGDGLLRFAPLLIADLAALPLVGRQGLWPFSLIHLTLKGQRLLDAWCSGNRERVRLALTDVPHGTEERGDCI
jgi:hypothetical protein